MGHTWDHKVGSQTSSYDSVQTAYIGRQRQWSENDIVVKQNSSSPHCQTALESHSAIDIMNTSSGNILFLKCRGACCLGSWLFDQSQSPGSRHDCAARLPQTYVATCHGLPEVSPGHYMALPKLQAKMSAVEIDAIEIKTRRSHEIRDLYQLSRSRPKTSIAIKLTLRCS